MGHLGEVDEGNFKQVLCAVADKGLIAHLEHNKVKSKNLLQICDPLLLMPIAGDLCNADAEKFMERGI